MITNCEDCQRRFETPLRAQMYCYECRSKPVPQASIKYNAQTPSVETLAIRARALKLINFNAGITSSAILVILQREGFFCPEISWVSRALHWLHKKGLVEREKMASGQYIYYPKGESQ